MNMSYFVIFALILLVGCYWLITRMGLFTSPMIGHTSLSVKNYEKGMHFYDQTLAELGYKRNMTIDIPEKGVKTAGYGAGFKPSFWISSMGNPQEAVGQARGVLFAFSAPNAAAVDAWHKKCLELGATNNGNPGPRPEYHPGYYGAFVIDPDGWRLEAVCHFTMR